MSAAPTSEPKAPLLVARGITKAFGRTPALVGADFTLQPREIHGLVGAFGSGKSTLGKIIAGHVAFDEGEITYRTYPIRLRSTRDAIRVGIAMVTQETTLAPDMTVLENIFLPELGRPGWLDRGALRARARELLASFGQADAVPLDTEVGRLSSGQKQIVEIAKALGIRAKLIVFDEPTASLSSTEVDRLFDIMARLRLSGRGLVLVSHRPEDVVDVTDRLTVLRDGRATLDARRVADITPDELAEAMVGSAPRLEARPGRRRAASEDADTARLVVHHLASAPAVQDVSFAVAGGEILGLAGLVGAGRSEVAEAIFGLRPRAGDVHIDGQPLRPEAPRAAIRAGIGFVPEDRPNGSFVPDMSLRENLFLAHLGTQRGFGRGYQRRAAALDDLAPKLQLPLSQRLDSGLLRFPGDVQQRAILGRWLLLDPGVLIVDEPTRGVAIATRATIHALLRETAAKGAAVVVVSSDFEELLALADRVVVLSDGRSVADLPAAMLDREALTLLAAPRSSVARNTALLEDLTAENGGVGFWALIEGDHVIGLNAVVADASADPGFAPGEARMFDATRIPEALRARQPSFIREADGTRTTLLVPVRSPRGQNMGWVGLTLPGGHAVPPAAAIKFRIDTLAASL
ncbi:sugar ABC transporter ATP-binding protein [Lichenihabitans sp. Uapishka_5]|uniref:sugar ABC transporter ATP-binding protein n=1 Tax=Lichenihabitans sp. Uapishka_5 TaxID=3037302 RepID=UPI0029E7DBA4|nr:sugar ABC transporter ATP-binding protein [Lichenihabitans sp. Uapishka_5]MDX7951086.1 sugar ABC transporter ATP-binding protein [Lichenihabitans sp. Uapishka_5]